MKWSDKENRFLDLDENEQWLWKHGGKCSVHHEDFYYLEGRNMLCIHYPVTKWNKFRDAEDSESIDQNDYESSGDKNAIKRFSHLNSVGGYVILQSRSKKEFRIGKAVPSSFKIWIGKPYHVLEYDLDRPAKVKTLEMEDVVIIGRDNPLCQVLLEKTGGRSPTISRCVSRFRKGFLRDIIEGREEFHIEDISETSRQNICVDFLREHERNDIPVMILANPYRGKEIEGYDIRGWGKNGEDIWIQETMLDLNTKESRDKMNTLKEFKGVHIYICRHDKVEIVDGIFILPISLIEEWWKKELRNMTKQGGC